MSIALEARGLTKEFKGFVAVNSVNLKVEKGTVHALIGPNGAGKTTFFNLPADIRLCGALVRVVDCRWKISSAAIGELWSEYR